jgi:hypothetical protein
MASQKRLGDWRALFGDSSLVAGAVSAFLSGVDTVAWPHRQALEQLGQFISHFASAAAQRFVPLLEQPCVCSMRGCRANAVLHCLGCGEPACLAHLHLSHRAEGLCDQCVRELLRGRPRAVPRRTVAGPSQLELRQARQVLGVRAGASWEEIRLAHRRRAAKFHPDRARTAAQRQQLELKCRKINQAFDVLRAEYERRAA